MSSLEQRANIKFCVLLEKSPSETLEMLKKAYGNDAMKKTAVYKWHKRFHKGRTNIKDDHGTGHPSSSNADENVESFREIGRVDRRITIDAILPLNLEFHMGVFTAFFMMI
ncbi:Putative uncharacterized protein FLJ37770 [Araneus ventricosus]|uniref:Mos1 transposase HTH domain-containing protein n=1 Tax=Araneus ventricosus TaxID=182803 RepID=A0A4Y2Q8V0_ARAVE|nr:Putative uncharacterized protein FLJ37770 [Araneus ventricosus]